MNNSRRDFIKTVGATVIGAGLAGCTKGEIAHADDVPPLTHLSATKLSQLIAKREVSAEEVAEAYLAAHRRGKPENQCYRPA